MQHAARHPATFARAALAAAGLFVALVAWGGCEIRDEVVETATPRAVRISAAAQESGGGIEYVEGYDAGLRRAQLENRPLLVVFRAAWCRWCVEFSQGTLVDRRLVGLSRQFVCVIVDADRHAADCRRFGVKEFPTVLVATAGGVEQHRWRGCPTVEELVAVMAETLPTARMAAAGTDDSDATR